MNLKLSDSVIKEYDGTFKGSKTHVVYLSMYEFKDLKTG